MTIVQLSTSRRADNHGVAGIKIEIPRALHQALIRIQADEDLDFESACLKAATCLDSNRQEYKKAVLDEADKLAKSRSITQINKARKTIQDSAYQKGYDSGHKVGYDTGHSAGYNAALTQFSYPCGGCGQTIYATLQNEWKWLVDNGHLADWRHQNCRQR